MYVSVTGIKPKGITGWLYFLLYIDFDVYSDTPKGKDPDSFSPTLRKYHYILWSKCLPNGKLDLYA